MTSKENRYTTPPKILNESRSMVGSCIANKAKLLSVFLAPRLSCMISESHLNITSVGIQLYDPFDIQENTERPLRMTRKLNAISLRSKSTKSLLRRGQSMKGTNTKSYRFIPTEIEIDENDTRYYVFYDDLSRSRSRKKLSPLNLRRNNSPYSSN